VEDERSSAASALKPLGEIVAQDAGAGQDLSCLGKVERLAELHSYRSAGAAVLQNHADGAEHRQAAVLGLLHLLLEVLLGGVVEVEGVVSALAQAQVAHGLVADDASAHAEALHAGCVCDDVCCWMCR
jgi:hypothetical protein